MGEVDKRDTSHIQVAELMTVLPPEVEPTMTVDFSGGTVGGINEQKRINLERLKARLQVIGETAVLARQTREKSRDLEI